MSYPFIGEVSEGVKKELMKSNCPYFFDFPLNWSNPLP